MGGIYAALADADAYTVHSRAEQLLTGLGFTQAQMHLPLTSFSGGWRMRLNLAQALMCPSDLLLLDERSLAALSAGQLATVRQALREGLGVLVRSAGAPSASARQRLHDLGLPVQGEGSSRLLELPGDGESTILAARRGPRAAGTLPTGYGEEADRPARFCRIVLAPPSAAGARLARAASACCR
ncbi:hypothetical protein G6F60_014009 [Rhizopus arrhizus]|nr:hypothetical protein G6F60_014009 [Rhizopus arrhizus]